VQVPLACSDDFRRMIGFDRMWFNRLGGRGFVARPRPTRKTPSSVPAVQGSSRTSRPKIHERRRSANWRYFLRVPGLSPQAFRSCVNCSATCSTVGGSLGWGLVGMASATPRVPASSRVFFSSSAFGHFTSLVASRTRPSTRSVPSAWIRRHGDIRDPSGRPIVLPVSCFHQREHS
jgi:hypothetical protein